MLAQHEVHFKLLPRTVNQLLGLYEHACSSLDHTFDQAEMMTYLPTLRENFAKAIDQMVYAVEASVLEELQSDGSGEVLAGHPAKVKRAILDVLYRYLPLHGLPQAAEGIFLSSSRRCRCWRCVTM